MRVLPSFFYIIFISFFLITISVSYFLSDGSQNEVTQYLDETVNSYLVNSVDLGTTRVNENIYFDQSNFESVVRNRLIERYLGSNISFDYLPNGNQSLKALKVSIEVEENVYTSTYKIREGN